jgi:ComF family protein
VQRLFYGRLPLAGATAFLHFSEGGMTQSLIHRMKYKGQKKLCELLGSMFGQQLKHRGLLTDIDVIIPVPLHPARERRRGYNQSALVCQGLAEHLGGVVVSDAVVRAKATDTQTRKARFDRAANMQDVFSCVKSDMLKGKTVLIVDDVVTTGSTLEGVGHAVLSAGTSRLYVLAVAFPN